MFLTHIPRSDGFFMGQESGSCRVLQIENYVGQHDGRVPSVVGTDALIEVQPLLDILVSGSGEISRVSRLGEDQWWCRYCRSTFGWGTDIGHFALQWAAAVSKVQVGRGVEVGGKYSPPPKCYGDYEMI